MGQGTFGLPVAPKVICWRVGHCHGDIMTGFQPLILLQCNDT